MKLDFHELAYTRFCNNFADEIGRKTLIPTRDISRFFGILYSLKKPETRALLSDFSNRYGIKLSCRGIRIP